MRALLRYVLAPLIVTAALAMSAASMQSAHAAVMHPSACPETTHWDTTTGTCVPD